MVLDGNSLHKYPVNTGFVEVSILGLTLYLIYIIDLSIDVICNIAMYAVTLYTNCNQASDFWQQLWLAFKLETDLWDSVDCMHWGRKWLVDFNARKTEPVLFDHSSNGGFINVKVDGSFIDEKSSLKMLGLFFSFSIGALPYIVSFG